MAAEASGAGEGPSTSSGAAEPTSTQAAEQQTSTPPLPPQRQPQQLSRYESQKRRDWNTFLQYLRNHKPPLTLARCSGAHVIEFLKYLDQFGKTKVHASGCAYFGHPNPPAPCPCPLRQAWGSLDALIGRLRAAYEESGGRPESNPFGVRPVRIYLREVRESQAKARGIPYEKKKRKRVPASTASVVSTEPSSGGGEASSSSASAAAAAAAATATASTSVSAAATGSSSTSGTAEGEGSSTKPGGASTSLV